MICIWVSAWEDAWSLLVWLFLTVCSRMIHTEDILEDTVQKSHFLSHSVKRAKKMDVDIFAMMRFWVFECVMWMWVIWPVRCPQSHLTTQASSSAADSINESSLQHICLHMPVIYMHPHLSIFPSKVSPIISIDVNI